MIKDNFNSNNYPRLTCSSLVSQTSVDRLIVTDYEWHLERVFVVAGDEFSVAPHDLHTSDQTQFD